MSKVKTDAIETRAGGTSVLTIGTATQTIKLPGGTPGLSKVLTSDATGEASWAAAATATNAPAFEYQRLRRLSSCLVDLQVLASFYSRMQMVMRRGRL